MRERVPEQTMYIHRPGLQEQRSGYTGQISFFRISGLWEINVMHGL
jgi:hypothetical protein